MRASRHPRMAGLIGVVAMLGGALLGVAPARAGSTPFTDIGGSIFVADISWAYAEGITAGCTATRFCPDDPVTREQMASFLDRMFHLPPTATDFFVDDEASIHEGSINRLAAAGITGGCAADRYCPKDLVTREQMASFLARAAGLTTGAGRNYFLDDDFHSHEANIDRVAAAGISGGCQAWHFCPSLSVTRGQMAAFLHRVVDPVAPPPLTASVLVGAGDIGNCSVTTDEATASLLDGIAGTVFTAGDNAYPDGTATQFNQCYAPTWGRHRARTRPSPGNHDYHTAGAAGYFGYFGAAAGPAGNGYYAYDIGVWRIYSLNSEVVSAAEVAWLRGDLASNPRRCTLAYWHRPRYATPYPDATHASDPAIEPLWDALADAGAALVVNGHAHHYERFAPNRGVTEVIVGTGGTVLQPFGAPIAGSVVRDAVTHGVIKVTLGGNGYSAEFVPIATESFTDAFAGSCQ